MQLNANCYHLVAFGTDLRFPGLWGIKILKNSKPNARDLKICLPLRILVWASLQSPSISSSLFLVVLSYAFFLTSSFFFVPFNLEPKFEEEIGNCLARWYPIPPRISMRSSSLQQNFLQSLNMWITCLNSVSLAAYFPFYDPPTGAPRLPQTTLSAPFLPLAPSPLAQ